MLVEASGECLQASAAGGFGLTTPAEWLLLAAYTLIRPRAHPLRQSKLPVGVPSGTAEAGDP